ncbi:hypothetical protein IJT17_02380, partial [bacterium]|nr:hypothetical protein [bacterium]
NGIDKANDYHHIMGLYAKLMHERYGYEEVYLALVYINHKRSPKHGGPIFLDCGRYSNGTVEWDAAFAPKLP